MFKRPTWSEDGGISGTKSMHAIMYGTNMNYLRDPAETVLTQVGRKVGLEKICTI